jgi:Fe-S oxidoreductase
MLQQHIDVFVNNFFINGARNYIRKTTRDAPWLNVGIMEKTNSEAFYSGKLFSGLNVVGGGGYSLGHGLIHGHLKGTTKAQIERAVANLNSLGTEEIIFYHDESIRGLEQAHKQGLKLQFKPVTFLEWLIQQAKGNHKHIQPMNIEAAVQLPCSRQLGDKKNALIEELFDLLGVKRVERRYDFDNRLCCGAQGYFGLLTGDTMKDSDWSDKQVEQNIEDAKDAGAKYMVTTCPYCFAAIASAAKTAGITPIQIEGLASLALFNEPLPEGLSFL